MTAQPISADDLANSVADAVDAAPTPVRSAVEIAGDAGSRDSVKRLHKALAELKVQAALPWFQAGVKAMQACDWQGGAEAVLKGLELDEKSGLGWHLLAICREKTGDYPSAFAAYETALKLIDDPTDIANDLGRLAQRLGQLEIAEKLYHHFLARRPGHVEAVNNLASLLRDLGRYGEAIELLRPVIYANPEEVLLWNTLGTVLSEQSDVDQSFVFFDEALRLKPDFAKARYNRGNARMALGDPQGALEDINAALPGANPGFEEAMMKMSRATVRMALGDLAGGFEDYEERFSPHSPDAVRFATEARRWSPEDDVAGRRVLVVAEQGLGDEVLFANVLPDLAEAIGPDGKLYIAVEKRLVPLFQRSFPDAVVGAHRTFKISGHHVRLMPFMEGIEIDLWAPIASLFRRFRPDVASFPDRERYLIPDAARVEHWRRELAAAGDGRKVGVLWKSLNLDGTRRRYFSPFDLWKPVLATPGTVFVNLQYGDCDAELAAAEDAGLKIWQPPGIDLKLDLDDVAALCCALDLVVGPANATTNIGAACGAPVWLITTPDAWPRFGTDRYPTYPQVRTFHTGAFNAWEDVMGRLAAALAELG